MSKGIHASVTASSQIGRKQFAVLIDPDKSSPERSAEIAGTASKHGVDFILAGSSILKDGNISGCIQAVKSRFNGPVILFPGSPLQIDNAADGILFLSLISGRNPDLLIGNHVIAAPLLKSGSLEIIPTGYMLIDGGNATTAAYMSNTFPIPAGKTDIAACTAMAGELLGLKMIYMDAGSGAASPVSSLMISKVRAHISIPLMVGGGITSAEEAVESCKAGADIIVVGNALERDPSLLGGICDAVHSCCRPVHSKP